LLRYVRNTATSLTYTALHIHCTVPYPDHNPTNQHEPQSLELVLQNINKLNRSLEEITQVGNEFAPVESLWSHFENVMAKDTNEQPETAHEGATEHEGEETEVTEHQK